MVKEGWELNDGKVCCLLDVTLDNSQKLWLIIED